MSEQYYNPLEFNVQDCGQWIKHFPVYAISTLYKAIPNKRACLAIATHIAMLSASNTYMSKKQEIQPVKVSTVELAEIFGMQQNNVSRALADLEQLNWIKKVTGGKGKISEYTFDFDRLQIECKKQYSSIKSLSKSEETDIETEVHEHRREARPTRRTR